MWLEYACYVGSEKLKNWNIFRWQNSHIALVLAVLDFSIELGDKESVDETLEESKIAPDLESVYTNLDNILDTVQAKCPNEQNILQYSNFSK